MGWVGLMACNSLVALGLLLARILHLRRVSAFGKDADGIQFLPQA